MKTWNCSLSESLPRVLKDKIFQPESSEVSISTGYTIGQKIEVKCNGESINVTDEDWSLKVIAEKEEKIPQYWTSQPVFVDASTVRWDMASYKIGTQAPKFILSQGNQSITLELPNFEVVSILDKHDFKMAETETKSQQGPQPYPFIGPQPLSYPLLFWLAILVILVGVFTWLTKKAIRYWQLKRWQEDLQNHQLAMSPENFFYKELRRLQRDKLIGTEAYSKLQNAYYVFLEHGFLYPVRQRSIREVTSYIMTKHRLPQVSVVHMKKNLMELKKIETKSAQLDAKDVEKVSTNLRKNVDELQEILRAKGRS